MCANKFSLEGKNVLVICPENNWGPEIVKGLVNAGCKVFLAGPNEAAMATIDGAAGMYVYDHSTKAQALAMATLVQSCNRLKEVINPAMQNIIKREIVSSLAVETEGETDLEEENGIYLGIENDRQEFKTSFFHAPQSAKEQRQEINIFRGVCAFLNTTEGGTLYLGVNDLGYVHGIDEEIAYLQKISYGNYKGVDGYMRYITDRAKTYFNIDVVVNIKTRPMYDNKVVALEITPYEYGIVKLDGQAYLRVNGESVAINEAAVQRMEQRQDCLHQRRLQAS